MYCRRVEHLSKSIIIVIIATDKNRVHVTAIVVMLMDHLRWNDSGYLSRIYDREVRNENIFSGKRDLMISCYL